MVLEALEAQAESVSVALVEWALVELVELVESALVVLVALASGQVRAWQDNQCWNCMFSMDQYCTSHLDPHRFRTNLDHPTCSNNTWAQPTRQKGTARR